MLARIRSGFHAWLIALDQFAYATLAQPAWWIGQGDCPSPYETISSSVGRQANAGWRWALVARSIIDRLFTVLVGSEPGHCERSIIRAEWLKALLP